MKIRAVIYIVLLMFFVSGCTPNLVPDNRIKNSTNRYGAKIIVTLNGEQIEGEFIALLDEQLFVWKDSLLFTIEINSIRQGKLTVSNNRSKKYLIRTGIFTLPAFVGAAINPTYADSFLGFGGVIALWGLVASGLEAIREPHVFLIGKEGEGLSEYSHYARFPVPSKEILEKLE